MLNFPAPRMVSPDERELVDLVEAAFAINLVPLCRVISIAAREIDTRMFTQQGAFTIHGDATDLADIKQRSAPWRRMFRVPGRKKAELGELLRRLAIHKGSLFPDLGALAEDLKTRWYSS